MTYHATRNSSVEVALTTLAQRYDKEQKIRHASIKHVTS